jgi:flagellar biosynthetic protein FliS
MVPREALIYSYRRASYEQHSGPRLLVDLCRKAVRDVAEAREAVDVTTRREQLAHARQIVLFLQESLSLETGGSLAVELFRHYTYLIQRLAVAEIAAEPADLDTLQAKLETLRNTWAEAVRDYEEEQHVQHSA